MKKKHVRVVEFAVDVTGFFHKGVPGVPIKKNMDETCYIHRKLYKQQYANSLYITIKVYTYKLHR